jgi:hypothetical protein
MDSDASRSGLKARLLMARGRSLLYRLSLPLLIMLCPGCSDVDSGVFPANHQPNSSAAKATTSPTVMAAISAEEAAIVSSARVALEPVIAALEAYHRQHGRYPAALENLVDESLLAKFPELPPANLALNSGLEFRSSPTPDFFVMMFHYRVQIPQTGYATIDEFRRVYASDDRRGWVTPDSVFVSMGDLIADRLVPLWREKHDPEILSRCMTEAVGTANCEFLLQSKVVGWLGKGSEIKIPAEVLGPDRTGFCYQADGDRNRRYCFVYKKHWFGHFTCPSLGALTKGPLVFNNKPVLDKLFLIRRDHSGKVSWELLRTCPPSDLDRRPQSGPGTVVEDG